MSTSSTALPPDGDLQLLEQARSIAIAKGFSIDSSYESDFREAVRNHWDEPGYTFEEAQGNNS